MKHTLKPGIEQTIGKTSGKQRSTGKRDLDPHSRKNT